MSIVGFNFTRIVAERKGSLVGTVNINNTITLKDIAEAKLGLGTDRGAIKISFVFKSDYNPNFASIQLEGDVLMLIESQRQASVIDRWKTSRALAKDLAEPVMNHILERANIQALLLSKDLNLPSPVRLPKVQVTDPEAAPVKSDAKGDEKKKKK
jgi:hypothetical protein